MGRYKTAWDDDPHTYDVWEERPERDELIANGVSERRANQLIWGAEPEPREGERKER